MSYKYYQALEAGRKRELRLSTIERLAAAYGIAVWELLAPAVPKVHLRVPSAGNRNEKSARPKGKRSAKAAPTKR